MPFKCFINRSSTRRDVWFSSALKWASPPLMLMMAKNKKSSLYTQQPSAPKPKMVKKKKKSDSNTPQPSAAPITGNFWTPDSKQQFHVAVAQLYDKTEVPDGTGQGYRDHRLEHCADYVMKPSEELQLADDIAFLFSWKNGAKNVTATTLEEHDEGRRLVIWLGVNESPPQRIVDEFQDLMRIVERHALIARERDKAHRELLAKVVEIRSKRILQRLQALNAGRISGRDCEPLHERITRKVAQLQTTPEYTKSSKIEQEKFNDICLQLEDLFHVYRTLDTCAPDAKHIYLISAVEASHDLSTRNSQPSFLSQLESFCFQPNQIQVNDLLQVDKISHYHDFCTNILRLARRYPKLFSKIEVKLCDRPPDSEPSDLIESCHVHGEVQLVLHHERAMHHPNPRCLGSSKSLCFLCGLFVERHGRYWISHSHKRLYHKWTIPDTNWMNEEQTLSFQRIVREMTSELVRLRGVNCRDVQYPPESRNHLPFSVAASTASKAPSVASLDSDVTVRQGQTRSGSGSVTPVVERQSNTARAKGEPATSPAPDQLSGSTLAECVRILSSSATTEQSLVIEYRPRSALLIPLSNIPPTSPVPSLHSPPPPSSNVSALSIPDETSPPMTPRRISKSPILSPTTPPPPLSPALSVITPLPFNLPHTHTFHFRSPDLEITIAGNLFIFEFETTVIGTLTLSWIGRAATMGPIIPLDGNENWQVINVAKMGREATCFKREESRCEFAVRAGQGEAVRIVVCWEDE